MTAAEIKTQLYQLLQEKVDESIAAAQQAMQAAEESRNNETKSSVGDKYETGRAMMQLEHDRHKAQLMKAQLLRQQLKQINVEKQSEKVIPGSLVITNRGNYFLAIGLGKLLIGSEKYFAISAEAPIGKVLLGKEVNETLSFNGQPLLIVSIH